MTPEATQRDEELKNVNYELFILALSLLSVFNWALYFMKLPEDVLRVVFAVDLLLSVIFMVDFLYRLFTAESKRRYLLKQYGWLDLLSSLPFLQVKIARVARIVRALRLLREFGLKSMIYEFFGNQAGSAMYTVAFLIILVLEFGSISILAAEQNAPEANIMTAGDALWWSIVTVSTVGYGDQYPVTAAGRFIAIVIIIVGVGLFGVVTGFLANRFLTARNDDEDEQTPAPDQGPAGSDSSAVILEEIARLRQEQAQAYADFNIKLERLFSYLEESSS